MSWVNQAKRRVAEAAAVHIKSGDIIGLGSGSTVRYLISFIGSLLDSGKLINIWGIPTSHQAYSEAIKSGIPLTSLDKYPQLDISIDGADQIDEDLDVIKGRGGALLREKVVASASRKYIIIGDETKFTSRLGDGCPIPLEVLPFSLGTVIRKVEAIGSEVKVRSGNGKLGPIITDNGNFIIDAYFGAINNPRKLEGMLKSIPGVLETGLFLGYADLVYIGTRDKITKLERTRNNYETRV